MKGFGGKGRSCKGTSQIPDAYIVHSTQFARYLQVIRIIITLQKTNINKSKILDALQTCCPLKDCHAALKVNNNVSIT